MRRKSFSNWLVEVTLRMESPTCVMSTDMLREAYNAGRTPEQMAKLNDSLANEYGDSEQLEAA